MNTTTIKLICDPRSMDYYVEKRFIINYNDLKEFQEKLIKGLFSHWSSVWNDALSTEEKDQDLVNLFKAYELQRIIDAVNSGCDESTSCIGFNHLDFEYFGLTDIIEEFMTKNFIETTEENIDNFFNDILIDDPMYDYGLKIEYGVSEEIL